MKKKTAAKNKRPSHSAQPRTKKQSSQSALVPKNRSHFDLIVIGSGPAGQKAALQASKIGKKVLVVEAGPSMGGACVQWGTLPSKSFRESVYRYSLSSRGVLGVEGESGDITDEKNKNFQIPQMERLLRRKDRVVSEESEIIEHQLLRNHVAVIRGRGSFLDQKTLEVVPLNTPKKVAGKSAMPEKLKYTADYFVISTGARPVSPAHLSVDQKRIHDSDSILSLHEVPKRLVVLGGGIIGCEYASMFSMAGTEVILVDKRTQILSSVDKEVIQCLMGRFTSQGMKILLSDEATKIEVNEKSKKSPVKVTLASKKTLEADAVLVALGRRGNTESLNLDRAGVSIDERGLIPVDAHFRTNIPHIYACGDVIGSPALASTSMAQGRLAVCHIFDIRTRTTSNAVIEEHQMPKIFPYGIYTIPEISMIGKSEEELITAKVPYVSGQAHYRELARGQIVGDRWGLLKILVHRESLKILGVHIIGDNAADLIHIGQAVMAFEGDVTYFINSVFNYPTLAEAYKTAAFHAMNGLKKK